MTDLIYRPKLFVQPDSPAKFGKEGEVHWYIPLIKSNKTEAQQRTYLRASVLQHLVVVKFRHWLTKQPGGQRTIISWWRTHPELITHQRLGGLLTGEYVLTVSDLGLLLCEVEDLYLVLPEWPDIVLLLQDAEDEAGLLTRPHASVASAAAGDEPTGEDEVDETDEAFLSEYAGSYDDEDDVDVGW
ncbi:MAG: hypothetical protein ACYDGN_09390 [Acidimicrobiales bacterium]